MRNRTFTPETRVLPMHYPGFAFRVMRQAGYCPEALLRGTSITQEQLEDPQFRGGYTSLKRFYLNLIELSGDPHIGIRIAQKFEPQTAGMPVLAALTAPTFESGLKIFCRFVFLTYPAIEFALINPEECSSPNECALRVRHRMPSGEVSYFAFSSTLVVLERIFQAMTRRPKVAHRAEIVTSKPEKWDRIACELSLPVQFDAKENQLFFHADLLESPLPGTDILNHRHLTSICEQMEQRAGFKDTLAHQVSVFLEEASNNGASMTKAACALGVSERSLRRELELSGTSYRRLVRDARERHARRDLITTDKSIQAIAFELGFDTASNFSRSFKQWTGVTPSAFRERQTKGGPAGQN